MSVCPWPGPFRACWVSGSTPDGAMSHSAIAMAYGIVGSVLFHLSKGMQRHGIEAMPFQNRKPKDGRRVEAKPKSKKKTAIYWSGFALNNSLGLCAILANRHAPSSYFTSMFCTGLIALMLYSGLILKETVKPIHYAGAVVLTAGTLILGYDGILRPKMTMADVHLPAAGIVLAVSFLLGGILYLVSRKKKKSTSRVLIVGFLIGLAACVDPILKGIGQNLGSDGGRYLPRLPLGWVIFLSGFFFATVSLVASQWAFSRGFHASTLIPGTRESSARTRVLVALLPSTFTAAPLSR